MNKILLSICIPTYNRSNYLEQTILSIIHQDSFVLRTDIEIVISDNCSTDNTKEVVEKFIFFHPNKIRYFRNEINIKDENYQKVLSHGRGSFLKLNNDTLQHKFNTLDVLIKEIEYNIRDKNIIFFTNGNNVKNNFLTGLDSFINSVSFLSTWIACFGIWKVHFDGIQDFSRNSDKLLVQTDVLFRLISTDLSVCINSSEIFHSVVPTDKKIYNFFKVFLVYYLEYLEHYKKQKKITFVTLFREKARLFLFWFIPSVINLPADQKPYPFSSYEIIKIVFNKYKFHPVLYIGTFILLWKLIVKNFKESI
jgi:glycosyltransferase involved in cell wall biosynthesis